MFVSILFLFNCQCLDSHFFPFQPQESLAIGRTSSQWLKTSALMPITRGRWKERPCTSGQRFDLSDFPFWVSLLLFPFYGIYYLCFRFLISIPPTGFLVWWTDLVLVNRKETKYRSHDSWIVSHVHKRSWTCTILFSFLPSGQLFLDIPCWCVGGHFQKSCLLSICADLFAGRLDDPVSNQVLFCTSHHFSYYKKWISVLLFILQKSDLWISGFVVQDCLINYNGATCICWYMIESHPKISLV